MTAQKKRKKPIDVTPVLKPCADKPGPVLLGEALLDVLRSS